jgi:HSP20 family molecular chaperone IbpA
LGDPASATPKSTRIPQTEISEANEHFLITLSMPGVARERVEITAQHQLLIIRGSLSVRPQAEFKLIHQEYSEFDFQHSFTLPDDIDRGGITATSQFGILSVKIPKVKTAQPRQIPVSVG